MKIVYVSTTPWSGTHERWTRAMNLYGGDEHETRCLSPSVWYKHRRFKGAWNHEGATWDVRNKEYRNELLEWCDVVHCAYTCSLHTLGRPDLVKKKLQVWHLALRWTDRMLEQFPDDHMKHTRFVLACEGWERYPLPRSVQWTGVPQVFLLDDPEYTPVPFEERERVVSMSPRSLHGDATHCNFRDTRQIIRKMRRRKFKLIVRQNFPVAMRMKANSWVGIDDVFHPLTHLSGMEYLSLGVPCINWVDETLDRSLKRTLGCTTVPFISSKMGSLRANVDRALSLDAEYWRQKSEACRRWMEDYYHPSTVVEKYLQVYKEGLI